MKYRIVEKLYANDVKEFIPQCKPRWSPFWLYYNVGRGYTVTKHYLYNSYNTYSEASEFIQEKKRRDVENILAAKVIRVRKFDVF